MSHEILLSKDGFDKLKLELEQLKTVERVKVADNIREAKSHGDLRENAMYHEAKLNQTRLEARISELERTLQFAKVVDRPEGSTGAHLDSKVLLHDLTWDEEMTVILVGQFEADPANDKVSITSPLGAAILDREVNDEIEVQAPAGVQRYRIISIE